MRVKVRVRVRARSECLEWGCDRGLKRYPRMPSGVRVRVRVRVKVTQCKG